MDPIEIALKLNPAEFKGGIDESLQYAQQKLKGQNISGMSAAQVAEKSINSSVVADIQKALGGTFTKGFQNASESFKKNNPHLFGGGSSGGGGGGIGGSMGGSSGGGFRGKKPPVIADMEAKMNADKANFIKDMSFLMMPLMNPGSVWATLFSTRQTFSAFTKTQAGRGLVGGSLAGAGLVTGGLVAATTALGLGFKGLLYTVKEVASAFGNARKEYSRSLMAGGLPLSFTVRRHALAEVMGVSDRDAFQFGRQILYLDDRMKSANATIAKTAVPLTQVAWEFAILQHNFKAMFAEIAFQLSPAVLGVLDLFQRFTSAFGEFANNLDLIIRSSLRALNLGTALTVYEGVSNAGEGFKARHTMPSPSAYMKQLPASSWEHMGLVVGAGGTKGHLSAIEKNTKETAKATREIAKSAVPRSGTLPWGQQNAAP